MFHFLTFLKGVLTDFLFFFQDSDGEKSDDNLVVDVSNEVSMFLLIVVMVAVVFLKEGAVPLYMNYSTLQL